MSVILPYQYKYLADRLGEMYAKIRNAIYDESDPTCVYRTAQNTLSQLSDPPNYTVGGIDAESDATTWGCAPADESNGANDPQSENPSNENYASWLEDSARYTAPPASIGKDLKTFWFTMANTTFGSEQAKLLAATQIGSALRKLNSHIVTRMSASAGANRLSGGSPTLPSGSSSFTVSNIIDYYNNYAFVSDADASYVGMNASQLSLFDFGNEAGLDSSPTYFSSDFVELSARIGVSIPSQYQS